MPTTWSPSRRGPESQPACSHGYEQSHDDERLADEHTALLLTKEKQGLGTAMATQRAHSAYTLLPTTTQAAPTRPIPLRAGGRWTRRLLLIAFCFICPIFWLQVLFHYSSSNQHRHHPHSQAATPTKHVAHTQGVGHFSEWSIAQKTRFLSDLKHDQDRARNWIVVMGNEGGDLDSMASALLWAYHLTHNGTTPPKERLPTVSPQHSKPHPIQAVALLQTPEDALDLRPENKLALERAKMSPGHSDLLTLDELPIPPHRLAPMLHGIALVDHPRPRSMWADARVLHLFDHHTDRGDAPTAKPRIIERTASCSSLVAEYMLRERQQMKEPYHVSHELLELALSAIALDSDGLTASITTHTDYSTASKLYDLAPAYHPPPDHNTSTPTPSLSEVMTSLSQSLKRAKKNLGALSVRNLLRRDWKGDVVLTAADTAPNIHLGFASIPYSLRDMVQGRTASGEVREWFEVESGWTKEIRADVSVALTSFKVRVPKDQHGLKKAKKTTKGKAKGKGKKVKADAAKGKQQVHKQDGEEEDDNDDDDGNDTQKEKRREIILVVRADHRIDEAQADSLFAHLVRAVERDPTLEVRPWEERRGGEVLGPRQMVWTNYRADGGRKIVRPVIENAVKSWTV